MPDNRNSYAISVDHAAHVKANGYATYNHFQAPVLSVTGDHRGSITLEICTDCPFIRSYCNHETNQWNAAGTELRCTLCGKDGT